jgi:hypothetical protein
MHADAAARTAARMLKLGGFEKSLAAALDYRHNMYDYGTPGYLFWSRVIDLLVRLKRKGYKDERRNS